MSTSPKYLNRSNALLSALDLKAPIIGAPLGGASEYELVAALSRCGCFGFIGTGGPSYTTQSWIEEQIELATSHGDIRRIGVGIGVSRLAKEDKLLQSIIAAKLAAVWLSFGDPSPYTMPLQNAGKLVFSQVNNLAEAELAIAAGVDVIVAQGLEAGGHTGDTNTVFSLVPMIRDCIDSLESPELPFLAAAGSIVDGRTMLAALTLGADAVVLGTRLALSPESVYKQRYQQAVLSTSDAGKGTMLSEYADRLRGKSHSHKGRCLTNELFNPNKLSGLTPEEISKSTETCLRAIENEEASKEVIWSGQGASTITEILPVATIIERTLTEVEQLKQSLS